MLGLWTRPLIVYIGFVERKLSDFYFVLLVRFVGSLVGLFVPMVELCFVFIGYIASPYVVNSVNIAIGTATCIETAREWYKVHNCVTADV